MNAQVKLPPKNRQADSDSRLAHNQETYEYLKEGNQLAPICIPKAWSRQDNYKLSWYLPFAPGYVGAYLYAGGKLLRFLFQRLTFRFDKVEAYGQFFKGSPEQFVIGAGRDDHFAWRRIAGPNPLGLQQELDLDALRTKIPLDVERIENRLSRRKQGGVSLREEARAGRLFACDYRLMQKALRPDEHPAYLTPGSVRRLRDSRWGMKYLPAPIGVFLELPGFNEGIDLVPLAILIDQPAGARNRVFYPDEVPKKRKNWGWEIAKLYFETADEIFHAGCGHVLRTHLAMNPFCMATPRQLPDNHPVSMLLRPHTRFTLATNEAVYEYYVNPKKAYADFYSGKLEEHRRFSISSYEAKSFLDLSLPAELESRQVCESPEVYPYRDDALLWLKPIRDFVTEYIDAFYADDAAINHDVPLQAWKDELVHPDCGGVRGLVPDDALDTREKLVDLLAQVLFIAGPGHASQHFSEMYFYRYPPAFVGSAYAPPPWKECDANKARWYQTLPPIGQATKQFIYSTFGNFQYDTFGHYRRYPLGRLPEAQEPIRKLQAALREVESTIHARGATRPLRYDFLLPSRVPNSINI